MYLLRTVRPYLTVYGAMQIYRSMILLIMEYGSALYAAAANKHVSKLQTLQNSGLKAVFGLPRLTPLVYPPFQTGIDKPHAFVSVCFLGESRHKRLFGWLYGDLC